MNSKITAIAESVLAGGQIDRAQAAFLASIRGIEVYDLLYWANRIRSERYSPDVSFCAIASVMTGACSEDCAFCAQSVHHPGPAARADSLTDEQICAAAEQAVRNGANSFGLVTSGRRLTPALLERIAGLARRIRQKHDIRLCASLGTITEQQARALLAAGIQRYNHNLETSETHYAAIVTTHAFQDRVDSVRAAARGGLEVCCGGIFGIGETWDDRLNLAFTLRELSPAAIPLNFLHPVPGPLQDVPPLAPMEILHVIAMFRFVFPTAMVKVAGGRERNLRDLQSWIFYAGASSSLIGDYLTTTGRPAEEDHQMVRDLGLAERPATQGPPPSTVADD